jgi:hypothetical protein
MTQRGGEPPDEVWVPLDDQGMPADGVDIPGAVLGYHEAADARRRARFLQPQAEADARRGAGSGVSEEDRGPSRLERWQAEDVEAVARHPGAVLMARLLWLLMAVCVAGWLLTGRQELGLGALALLVLIWINGTQALNG